jgi:hypothetical protein
MFAILILSPNAIYTYTSVGVSLPFYLEYSTELYVVLHTIDAINAHKSMSQFSCPLVCINFIHTCDTVTGEPASTVSAPYLLLLILVLKRLRANTLIERGSHTAYILNLDVKLLCSI